MITKQTAYDIWTCYCEIEKGGKLAADIEEQLKQGSVVDLRDSFGRQRNFQLGVPNGDPSHRLFDVNPSLALVIIKAHVANKQNELVALNELVKAQL